MPTDEDDTGLGERMSADDQDLERQHSLFNERIGPLYTVESVARLLNRTEQQVRADIQDRVLLGIRLADGVMALPTRQFDENNLPLPGLPEVSATLDPQGTDPLSVALVLFAVSDLWGGGTAADFMRAGHVDEVVAAAARAYRSLAGP